MCLGFVLLVGNLLLLGVWLLKGCLVCVVVIMGMFVVFYCWYFCVYSVCLLECNILGLVGFVLVCEMLIGGVELFGDEGVDYWFR